MKKFIALLFLSLFVSQTHAAMMPIELNVASSSVVVSIHDHCQELVSGSPSKDAKSSSNATASHYCCAVVAILAMPPAFSVSEQLDVYLQADASTPASNIAESIYKPPRTYL